MLQHSLTSYLIIIIRRLITRAVSEYMNMNLKHRQVGGWVMFNDGS